MNWRAFAKDNAFVIGCVAASLLLHGVLLVVVGKKAAERGGVLVVPVGALAHPPLPSATAPANAEKVSDKAQLKKPVPLPKDAKKIEKKSPPKRVTTQKKPQPAKPPTQAKPGNADLVPLALQAPEPLGVDAAQLVRYQVENIGSEAAGSHHDALFFSRDDKLDKSDASLGMVEAGGTLAPGAKRWLRAQVLLPDNTPSGKGYLILVLNADGQMPETNHANNALVIPVTVDAAASPPLGDPNARPLTTVAWISSKDLRELKARQSRTLQPAVQNETEAQKQAKLHNLPGAQDAKSKEPKPVVVAKEAPEKPKKAPALEVAKVAPKPEEKKDKAVAKVKPKEVKKVGKEGEKDKEQPKVATVKKDEKGKGAPKKETEVATAKKEKSDKTGASLNVVVDPTLDSPKDGDKEKKEATAPQPAQPTVAKKDDTQGEGATSTPRDTSSAVPTQLDESDLVEQPGRVLVGKGVKITTMRPRDPGPAALIAGASHNPRVSVSFNTDGSAIRAEILRSSGNPDWDTAVLQSMYRWTAEGEQVKAGGLVVRWTVLLGGSD